MGSESEKTVKTTRLYDWHMGQGANIANFGGYLMPLWYPQGARNEHLRVLTHAGIFDTSHMAVILLEGPDARHLLQRCFSVDLDGVAAGGSRRLEIGRCVYGVFLNTEGHVIDDAIVYQTGQGTYMVVVNASMGGPVAAHLGTHAGPSRVKITDRSDRMGKLDVQGPAAARILADILTDPAAAFHDLGYFRFKGHFDPKTQSAAAVRLIDGTPILLSRTGYTGEFGFELFAAPERFCDLWRMIVDAGTPKGLLPCGLAARDSLRAGAGLALSHQDIGPWPFLNNPWMFALPWRGGKKGFTKSFVGDQALLQAGPVDTTCAFVGLDLRKVSVGDPARVLDETGETLGTVLTCVTDMALGWHGDRVVSVASPGKPSGFKARGLSCGFVRTSRSLAPGTRIRLQDHHRSIPAVVVTGLRPDRTARRPMSDFFDFSDARHHDRGTASAQPVT